MPKIFKIKSSTNLTPVVSTGETGRNHQRETFTYSSISAKLNNVLHLIGDEVKQSAVGILLKIKNRNHRAINNDWKGSN